MRFKTQWDWAVAILRLRVLDRCELVVSNELGILLLSDGKLMLRESGLVSDLVGDVLAVMSRWNRLVQNLLLVLTLNQIRVHKLIHLDVVCENVDREVVTLGDGNKLLVLRVSDPILLLDQTHGRVDSTSVGEGSEWGDHSLKLLVFLDVDDSNSHLLLVEELTHVECSIGRWIILQLVEQEGIVMILEQVDLEIGVRELLHVMK